MSMGKGWIGVDLDGTLAFYDTWQDDPCSIGAPIPVMVERVRGWIRQGYEVRIVTARVGPSLGLKGIDRSAITKAIEDWTERYIGHRLQVTCTKDFQMIRLYDDRACQVEKNTGRLIGEDG